MNTPRTLRALLTTLALSLALSLSGCAGMDFFGKDAPPASAQEQQALQAKADDAWRAGKYERALTLYGFVLQGQALTREAKVIALERTAKAALTLGRNQEALDALDNWGQTDPKVKSTWEWTSLSVQALSATGRERQAEELLAKIIQTRGASFELTGPAGIELAKRYASRDLSSQAAQSLRTLHAKAPSRKERAQYESETARMLGSLEPKALSSLLSTVNNANRSVFPYNLIAFEDLRRATVANPAERSRMQDLADSLSRSSDLADRGLPGRILTQGLTAATAPPAAGAKDAPPLPDKDLAAVKPGTVAMALLLPQTGQLRALAAKVQAGANAAKDILAAQGVQVDIRVINTDDPNFVDQLTALPHEVTLVGGPMHSSYFKNLPASGELSRRVFLAFMPEVAEAEEGKHIWRFFWSPQDEVNAVLGIPVEEGVKRFGVIYPEDRMGKRLADAFSAAAAARGAEVTAIQAYPPQDAPKWGDIVKTMVRATPTGTDGKSFTARPDFQAIFIPDELQRADHIIGQLQFYQADSLVILGPQLWSAAFNTPGSRTNISPANYRYAFSPGAWWPQSPVRAVSDLRAQMAKAQQGEPDFWAALGFDFVRLAAGAGVMPPDSAPSEISKRLNDSSRKMEWALAPITWDAGGHAKMNMFFLRPSVDGPAQVDKDGFRERLEALKAKQQPQ